MKTEQMARYCTQIVEQSDGFTIVDAHCGDLTRVEQILNITPDTLSDAAHDLACEREARTLAWDKARRRVKDYRYNLRHSTYDTAIAGLLDALDEMERLEEKGV